MPQFHSKQKPTSHSVTHTSSDKAIGEDLWMKGNIKPDHKRSPFGENTSSSPQDGQSIPFTEQLATVASGIAGNDHVSMIPWTDCGPDDPDKARELATSTGVPRILVCPANLFSHASDSQVSHAVDASQKSDEPRADMETQTSPRGVADAEIESQTTVRTPHLTGVSDSNAVTDLMDSWDTTKTVPVSSGFCNWKEDNLVESGIEGSMSPSSHGAPRAKAEQQTGEQSKMRQGGVGTMGGSEKLPAGLAPETQNAKPGDVKVHAHSVNASNNPEDLGSGEIAQYFNSSNFPAEWGIEEGIDVDSLLGDVKSLDKMKVPAANAPFSSDRDGLSQDNASSTVREPGSCKFGQLFVHQIGTSLNDLLDQKDYGGMDAKHGLPPWTKNSSGVTRGQSAKDTTYSNEERLSTSSVQLSGLRPTPSPPGDLNLSQPVSLSAVGHTVTTGDSAPSDAQPDIQVGSVAVAENDRNKSMDDAEKRDTDAYFSLNDGAREITNEDRITLGLHDGWPYKLCDANTGLPPMTEESWRVMETKQIVRRFASDGQSEVDTGSVTAENPSTNTRPPRPIVANVHRLRNMELDEPFNLFEPPEPKPTQQEEAASDMVDASEHNPAQLSAIPLYAANSKTRTHSVVDTAAHPTGAPEMNDAASMMKDTTKDMPANFGLQKWTGDDSVEPDIKDVKLVSRDSAPPESSSASQDVSFMLWTSCYPDDPDKARELEASTGVPGIRVYPVDVFRATSNPQVSNEVDASQNSDNARTEMETQVSPRRVSNE